jgi:Hint domain
MAIRGSSGGGTVGGSTCFMRGSRIAASEGSICVEDLAVGALVMTHSGQARPVRWLGHRAIDCTRYPNPAEVWPYRIRAGAFSDNQPARDLWLSRGHSILVDGVLMQVETLVNGASIVRVPSERVEYWHVELDSHDILIAEGLPAESYLDVGNRTAFVNGGAFLEAYPDFQARHSSETCVPVVTEGPAVQRAKAALLARAELLGYHRTDDADVHIRADGQRIDPVYLDPMRIAFMLPEARASIELRCRSFSPAQINPVSDDTRSLGICVSRLQLDGIDVPLDSEDAVTLGWHELERNPDGQSWRWSHDRTRLAAGTRLLVIDQCNKGPYYWMAPGARPVAAQVG